MVNKTALTFSRITLYLPVINTHIRSQLPILMFKKTSLEISTETSVEMEIINGWLESLEWRIAVACHTWL